MAFARFSVGRVGMPTTSMMEVPAPVAVGPVAWGG